MARQFTPFTVRADGLSGKKAFQFEASVLGTLHALDSIPTGRVLMDGFRKVGKEVLIFPYDGSQGKCNAYAYGDWGMFRNKVSYSPEGWFATSPCFKSGPAGAAAIEILFHELVHALRFAAKTMNKHVTDEQEEEIAILVTNLFASQTHRPLRWNHSGFAKLPNNDPVTFYGRNLKLIDIFCRQHPALTMGLARLDVEFNPLREYYDRER